VYYDSETHPDYNEAPLFTKAYRERNKGIMELQAISTGISHVLSTQASDGTTVYYTLDGMKVSHPQPNRLYIMRTMVDGRSEARKVMFT
jgi:hypothetical protein